MYLALRPLSSFPTGTNSTPRKEGGAQGTFLLLFMFIGCKKAYISDFEQNLDYLTTKKTSLSKIVVYMMVSGRCHIYVNI